MAACHSGNSPGGGRCHSDAVKMTSAVGQRGETDIFPSLPPMNGTGKESKSERNKRMRNWMKREDIV